MYQLIIGVGQVSLLLRYAETLKDKRQVTQSLSKKLRNLGFSVTEAAYANSPKQVSLGFSIVGTSAEFCKTALTQGLKLFDGNGEILQSQTDLFDYSETESEVDWERDEFEGM